MVPGGGAFEIAAYRMLMRRKGAVSGKAKLGRTHLSTVHHLSCTCCIPYTIHHTPCRRGGLRERTTRHP
ncbi:hypothetical protein EON63_17795 [archaeon]|nr:MAG: hypothetical protein EON63_17795 [archaeon]